MKQSVIKDIATALIARTAEITDLCAFEETSLPERDINKIMCEMQKQCSKMIEKIENKYQIEIPNDTTKAIVEKFIEQI